MTIMYRIHNLAIYGGVCFLIILRLETLQVLIFSCFVYTPSAPLCSEQCVMTRKYVILLTLITINFKEKLKYNALVHRVVAGFDRVDEKLPILQPADVFFSTTIEPPSKISMKAIYHRNKWDKRQFLNLCFIYEYLFSLNLQLLLCVTKILHLFNFKLLQPL